MPEEPVLSGPETEIRQVGVVVKDLDKTVEFLVALGLGPFTIRTATHPAATARGEKRSYEVRLALAQQGAVQLDHSEANPLGAFLRVSPLVSGVSLRAGAAATPRGRAATWATWPAPSCFSIE